ncbi:MAG: tetratricopeptide repeat protein [Chitinophagaceae bacterium]
MLYNLLIFILGILRIFTIFFGSAFLCTLVHEMGHAIPSFLFSKKKVDVYIGSSGEVFPSIKLPIGRFALHVSHNPFRWLTGMCIYEDQLSYNKSLVTIITGPIASVLLTLLTYKLLELRESISFTGWYLGVILLFAGWQSLLSIIPFKLKPNSSNIIGNDGYQFLYYLQLKRYAPQISTFNQLIADGKNAEAVNAYENELKGKSNADQVDRLAIWAYTQTKDYSRALELSKSLIKKPTANAMDLIHNGILYSMIEKHEKAIEQCRLALEMDPANFYGWCAMSYSQNVLQQYDAAIESADKALAIKPDFAAALDNRGLARLKTGLLEEGKADIEEAIRLDNQPSELYRNLGIYYLLKKDFQQALTLFEKAKSIDPNTMDIDKYIAEAKTA